MSQQELLPRFYKLNVYTIGRASGKKVRATSYHHGYGDVTMRLHDRMNGPNRFISAHIHPISEAEYVKNNGKGY